MLSRKRRSRRSPSFVASPASGQGQDLASRYLKRWASRQVRVFVAPSSADVAEIQRALGENGVDEELRREVSAVLGAHLERLGSR